ncbi:MAG: class II aldolase/adducin family protein [Actinobacteria bacterium]|nr:class II aldolase/adducin family protein [Actinomycetota bacterium]MCL6087908.1 class II aldolase/adducin family protein [Actinomycetota bacterium]
MHELQRKYESEIREIVFTSNRLADLGYVTSHGGNLSYRINGNIILITPTKVPKRKISFNDILIIDANGNVLFNANDRKPTGETPMHIRILNKRPDIKGLVHAHPPVLTGFSLVDTDLLSKPLLPEPILEVGPVISVEYAEPISDSLAIEFDKVIHKSNAFLMKNHGIIILSSEGVERALDLLEMIESMAISIQTSLAIGNLNEISKESINDLENIITKRNLKIPGDPRYIKKLEDLYE